jgi:hypothetical protein
MNFKQETFTLYVDKVTLLKCGYTNEDDDDEDAGGNKNGDWD